MEPVVTAKNLVKKYNGKAAVKGINFSVKERECFGILGPNGAGKSSIAKMIYCFSPVTQGDLCILGMGVREKQRSIKEGLGVVPQENNLDTELTVIENLLVYGSFFKIPARTVREKSEEMLEFFELLEYKNEKVDKLSGGMKRRLTIARALINSPQIMILDEPTTGLDPQARHLVWQRLRRLKEQGVTLLLTTHYMDEAEHLCDRLVVIDEGVILEEGRPQELVHKHIGNDVLEIGRGAEIAGEILKVGQHEIKGYKIIGDMLFVYPADSQTLIDKLRPFSDGFSHQMLRHANLEDVFLKLTGKGLAE
ncbi:MAG: ATP-binding cassette domain-containing protein [Peptococcaceae bacterium]|nr:ATP-binding cassette domain-containing protein [Peptococcaceae bacterium]